jgi:hypothetical protein
MGRYVHTESHFQVVRNAAGEQVTRCLLCRKDFPGREKAAHCRGDMHQANLHHASAAKTSESFIAEVEEAGPQEEDLQTEDHVEFYSNGKLALTVARDASSAKMWDALEAYMAKNNVWPNVWWISDHGNAHLMVRNPENEPGKNSAGVFSSPKRAQAYSARTGNSFLTKPVKAGRMTALEKKVMAHPAVADAHTENDGCFWTADGTPIPGIWVDLKPGWRHEDCISIHAPSWKEALVQLKSAQRSKP